jgi:predicted metal-binding membrane protein
VAKLLQLNHRSFVVSALGITQTLAWASTYYLTAVFADPVSADLHLPRIGFFGSVSGALLLSGLLGPVPASSLHQPAFFRLALRCCLV